MNKKIFACILILVMSFSLIACGGNKSGAGEAGANVDGKGVKALLTISDASDTFRKNLADAAEEAAQKCGVELVVKDAAGSSEEQMNHIKEATDVDVIICALCDVGTAQQMEALAGDKPMVFINSLPDEDYLEPEHFIYVGSDEAVAGQLQVDYVLEKYASKDTLNVAIFKGQYGHSATVGRTKANKEFLEASGKKINYVFDDYASWSADRAKEMFDQFLKTGQDIDVVFCNNDNMALGIAESVKANGMSFDDVTVLGVDATADGLASIAAGEMECTVFQSAGGQGEAAVWAAAQMVKGKSVTHLEGAENNGLYVWVPFETVTKDNYQSYQ